MRALLWKASISLVAGLIAIMSAGMGDGPATAAPEPAREARIQLGRIDPAAVPAQLQGAGAADREVKRARFVEFDAAVTAEDLRRAAAESQTVRLLLFNDEDLAMTTTSVEATFSGLRWSGTVVGERGAPAGWASFTYAFGTASWSVVYPGRAEYAIVPVDGGRTFRVIELLPESVRGAARTDDVVIPPSSLPGVAGDVLPATAETTDATAVGAVPIAADIGTVIDVLVAYTPAARAFAGGASQVQNAIAASLNSANLAYANSQVAHRLRLVASYESPSPLGATDLATGLAQVSSADGVMDDVHRFRDSFGADIALVWHDFVDSCGLAYVMTRPDGTFARYAFAAIDVEASCHGSWNTVAHEVGHLMASQHNVEDTAEAAMLPYGYGFRHVGVTGFTTVMAYPAPTCSSCPRIPYFSTPRLAYGGVPIGTATADNVRAMAATDEAVASFRTSLSDVIVAVAPNVRGDGYWTLSVDGRVRPFGNAAHAGDLTGLPLSAPLVDIAADPDGAGYWLTASDGGVFGFGAPFWGSAGAIRLNSPIVGMAPTASGRGYWLVASDGGIFTFGDAPFLGSQGGSPLNRPVVGMAATASGRGYWLVASDGGIFTFGDAPFLGSQGGSPLNRPVVGMAATASGRGYWLVASDGGIFTFGDAAFYGAAALG
jgi:hypothetical protein